MLVSFIIPVFNGEKFLRKCIDSLIKQYNEFISFEIICIDDYSIDKSRDIIREYQKSFSKIFLIENSKNQKTGTVCNIGLDTALGEYLWFVGQDDWIEENSLMKLCQVIAENNHPEVIAFNYRRVDFDENELHSAEVFDDSGLIQGCDYIRSKFGKAFPHYLLGYEWRAIFKREYLSKENIRFPDSVIYEDTTFLFKAILYSQKFISFSDYLYNYRVNDNSITDHNKKYKGSLVFEFAFIAGNEVLDLAKQIKDTYSDFSETLVQTSSWYFNGFVHKIIGASLSEKRCFYNELKKNNYLVIRNIVYMNILSRLLISERFGFYLSILLMPLYYIRRVFKRRNSSLRTWSY